MRIYALQYDIIWENKPANHELVRDMLADADPEPGSLVVLPEMFDTGFSLNIDQTDDSDSQESERFCRDLAREHEVVVQGARSTKASDGWGRNYAVVFDSRGQRLADYAKLHPFGFGREAERFRGGDQLVTYDWRQGEHALRAAPLICYDLRFPEAFRLCTTKLGAELFVLGANWPDGRQEHWRTLLIARAIENQAYVVGVNRCGRDPHLGYAGGSLIVSPKGEVLVEAGAHPRLLVAEIDPLAVGAWREAFGALRDIRAALLGELPGESSGKSVGESA